MFCLFVVYWLSIVACHFIKVPYATFDMYLFLGALCLTAVWYVQKRRLLILLLTWAFLGAHTASIWVSTEAHFVNHFKTDDIIEFRGKIFSVPQYQFGGFHFSFEVTQFKYRDVDTKQAGPVLCQVTVPVDKMLRSARMGDAVTVYGKIKIKKIKGEIALKDHILKKGHRVTLIAKRIEGNSKAPPETAIDSFRKYMDKVLSDHLHDRDSRAIMKALLLGERGSMSKRAKSIFKSCNLFHVFAISGLHMALLGGLFFTVLRLCMPLPFSHMCMLLSLFVYLQIVHYPPSAIRAFLMILCYTGAKYCFRKIRIYQLLGVVGLCVLLVCPYYANDPGFCLSFISVFLIFKISLHILHMYPMHISQLEKLEEKIIPVPHRLAGQCALLLKEYIRYNLYLWIVLAPMSIYFFNYFSVSSPVANMLVLPLMPLVLLLGLCGIMINHAGFTAVSDFCFKLLEGILKPLMDFLRALSDVPWTYIHIPHFDLLSCLMVYGILFLGMALLELKTKSRTILSVTK